MKKKKNSLVPCEAELTYRQEHFFQPLFSFPQAADSLKK